MKSKVGKEASGAPPDMASDSQRDLLADATTVCGKCTSYIPNTVSDHGNCPYRGRFNVLKPSHVCTIGKFTPSASGGFHAGT